ncbi:MAG TPA: hypothetical protein VH700_11660 [Gemmatimonadales bacterium]
MLRTTFRACLALILAGAFGFRVAALPAASGCVGGSGATPQHHSGHHEHDHRAPDSSGQACVCVAHVAGAGLAVEPARLAPAPAPRSGIASTPAVNRRGPSRAGSHVLPFSIGPPALLG